MTSRPPPERGSFGLQVVRVDVLGAEADGLSRLREVVHYLFLTFT